MSRKSAHSFIPTLNHNYSFIPTLNHNYSSIPTLNHNYSSIPTLNLKYSFIPTLNHNYSFIPTLNQNYHFIPTLNRTCDICAACRWYAQPGIDGQLITDTLGSRRKPESLFLKRVENPDSMCNRLDSYIKTLIIFYTEHFKQLVFRIIYLVIIRKKIIFLFLVGF